MSIFKIIGIAVGLALDAFAVAVVAGAVTPKLTARHYFRLSFHFGLFQALMPILGFLAGRSVSSHLLNWNHWIAFCLLAFIGGKMLFKPSGAQEDENFKSDPTRGSLLIILSVATSIDALAVGFSLALLNVKIVTPVLVIGAVAGVLTLVGMRIGQNFGKILGSCAERIGGIVLIGIGIKIIIEQLLS